MSQFNSSKNTFLSSINSIKSDLHSFLIAGVPKASKTAKQQKKALISNLTSLINEVDTDDFGIRIIIARTDK